MVNVQGDEPLILPEMIEQLVEPLFDNDGLSASCLVYPIIDEADLKDINTVKVVINLAGDIMYFSRSAIPNFVRGQKPALFEQSGVMAYRKDFLHTYSKLPPTGLEIAESVDMLRILEHSYKIRAVVWGMATIQVDLAEHIIQVEEAINREAFHKQIYERIINSET